MNKTREASRHYYRCDVCGYTLNVSMRWAKCGAPRCLNNTCTSKTQLLTRLGALLAIDLTEDETKEFKRFTAAGVPRRTALWVIEKYRSLGKANKYSFDAETVGPYANRAEAAMLEVLQDIENTKTKRITREAEAERKRLIESAGRIRRGLHPDPSYGDEPDDGRFDSVPFEPEDLIPVVDAVSSTTKAHEDWLAKLEADSAKQLKEVLAWKPSTET